MDTNVIESPQANDPVIWDTRFGTVTGHLVRYIDGDTALCEFRRGGLTNVHLPTANLRIDPFAFRPGRFQ